MSRCSHDDERPCTCGLPEGWTYCPSCKNHLRDGKVTG